MSDDDTYTSHDAAGQRTSTPTPLVTETLTPLASTGSSAESTTSTVAGINFSTMDIIEAVDLIMLLLNDDAEADMRSMLVEMQAINRNKQQMRQLAAEVAQEEQRLRHAETSNTSNTASAYTALLAEAQQAIEDRLDSLGELSEMAAQRLQIAIDRRSKFLTTLSNIMKKMSDTDAAIAQNLK